MNDVCVVEGREEFGDGKRVESEMGRKRRKEEEEEIIIIII